MTDQTKDKKTKSDADDAKSALIAAKLKFSLLNEQYSKEQEEASLAEAELAAADRAASACLQKSLTAQKKLNGTLVDTIAALSSMNKLLEKQNKGQVARTVKACEHSGAILSNKDGFFVPKARQRQI